MWKIYALLAAVFASLTAIFSKIGVKDIDSNLATAIRVSFILLLTWGMVFFTGATKEIRSITGNTLLFLFLSAIATGLSWLFYFKALQLGDVSKVAPIDKLSVAITILLAILFLNEPASFKTIIGGILITCGSLVLLL
jgi:transporter family protein